MEKKIESYPVLPSLEERTMYGRGNEEIIYLSVNLLLLYKSQVGLFQANIF